jgi:cytochrome c55X
MLAKKQLIALCAFHLILSSYTASADTSPNELTDDRKAELSHIVKQDCGSCHGMTLKGGLGPALLPENLEHKPILFLQNAILHGRPGTAMPPWKTLLTEDEALWISQQLKRGKITE